MSPHSMGNLISDQGIFPLDQLVSQIRQAKEPLKISTERTVENALRIAAAWISERTFYFGDTSSKSNRDHQLEIHIQAFGERTGEYPAAVFQTSGSTGEPKLVPLKRAQIIHAANASASNFSPQAGTAWLLCMPLHHVGGANVILRSVQYGTDVRFLPAFEAERVAHILQTETKVRFASLVPTQLFRLLQRPDFKTHDAFGAILLGGGPADRSLLEACRQREIPVLFSYGMTETCGQICATPFSQRFSASPETVGQPLPGSSITIVRENGLPAAPNEEGLIWIQSGQAFSGYLNQHLHETRFHPVYGFNSGDWGKQDQHGTLTVLSRRSDLIVSGGENIVPSEIESALLETGLVESAVCIGIPDLEWGQVVVAVVQGNPEREPELRLRAAATLPGFQRPKKYVWNLPVPMTASGKINRSALRASLS